MNKDVAHRRIATLHGHLRVEQNVQDGLTTEVQMTWNRTRQLAFIFVMPLTVVEHPSGLCSNGDAEICTGMCIRRP